MMGNNKHFLGDCIERGVKMLVMKFDKHNSIGDERRQKETKGDSPVSSMKQMSQLETKGDR